MSFEEQRILGRTNLMVGRLGISSSFGAPAAAFVEAFERGCNYFLWGTFIRGRSAEMRTAIRSIVAAKKRHDLVVSMVTYAHNARLSEFFLKKGLKSANLDHADVLLLGYYNKRPPKGAIEGALRLKEKGLVRFIGITSHNRKLFPELAKEGIFDVFHVRYNAAHRGAESETFPYLTGKGRPGIVTFTATAWQRLLSPGRMPPGQAPLTAGECYRFVLSHPAVDVCMMGAKTMEQMRENLTVLDSGPLTESDMERARLIGKHVHIR